MSRRIPAGKRSWDDRKVVLAAACAMAAVVLLGGWLAARRLHAAADEAFGMKELELPAGEPSPPPPPVKIDPPQDPGGPSLQPILTHGEKRRRPRRK